eukprot:790030_1
MHSMDDLVMVTKTTEEIKPMRWVSGSNFNSIRIALGDYHTCVISSSNTVKCYGRNDYGQLGYGDTVGRGDQVNEMGENLPEIDIGIGFATQSPTQSPTTSPSLSPTSAPSAPSAAPSIHPSAQPSGVTLYPTMPLALFAAVKQGKI